MASDYELCDGTEDLEGSLSHAKEGDNGKRSASIRNRGDILSIYMRQIAKYPLLNPQEGKELGRRIQMGREATEILAKHTKYLRGKKGGGRKKEELIERLGYFGERYDCLKSHERIDRSKRFPGRFLPEGLRANPLEKIGMKQIKPLERIAYDGIEALNEMVRSNLKLVVYLTKRFIGKGLDITDLIQEGNIGLMHGCESFNPQANAMVSSYVSWWIIQHMKRAITSERVIYIPHHALTEFSKAYAEFTSREGREPSDEELTDQMNALRAEHRKKPIGLDFVRDTRRAFESNFSIEDVVDKEGRDRDSLRIDSCPPNQEHALDQYDARRTLTTLFSGLLDSREEEIVKFRYGVGYGDGHTLRETGAPYRLTRERARQIEVNAINKIRGRLGIKEKYTGQRNEQMK